MSPTTTAPAESSPSISIDQATQLGLAINQALHRPSLASLSPLGDASTFAAAPDFDTESNRAKAVENPFDYFVSVGLLTRAQADALTAVLLGKASVDSLPAADPGAPSVYSLLRLVVVHRAPSVAFGFWDVISDIAEVVAGAALGFIAAGPAGAVAGGALAVVDVLSE